MNVELLTVGWCTVPRAALAPVTDHSGPPLRDWFRSARCPALVLLVEHPTEGVVLVDTGYAPRFGDATRAWPERAYALTTPMTLPRDQELSAQLASRGIAAHDVRHVVLTHLHADHVAGVRDFPQATLHATQSAVDSFYTFGTSFAGRIRATRSGMLRTLLPDDFRARVHLLNSRAMPTREVPSIFAPLQGDTPGEARPRCAYDVFGDGAILAMDLPGHAPGMVGIALPTLARPLFLVADAVWSVGTLEPGARAGLAERRVASDVTMAAESIRRLQQFVAMQRRDSASGSTRFDVISSHDAEAIQAYGNGRVRSDA